MPVPNNPFQNPFYNRFKDPVTRRHDEMDNYAWLRSQPNAMNQSGKVDPPGVTTKSELSLSEADSTRRHS